MDIRSLYTQGQYLMVLDQHLSEVLKRSYLKDDADIWTKLDELVMTLYSCFYCGAYAETLDLLKTVDSIDFMPWTDREADFLHFEFNAILYYLFNPEDYDGDVTVILDRLESIVPAMKDVYYRANIKLGDDILNRIKIYEDFKKGVMPYYIVNYLYPYEPPFGEGILDLTGCGPYKSLSIKRAPREKDIFTEFEFVINGYTNGDSFWRGHSWLNAERLPVVRKTLPTLNLILLRGMLASPGKYVPLYNIEQVSTAQVSVYANDGTPILKTLLATHFDAQWVGGNVPPLQLSPEGFNLLSKDIKNHYGCDHFFIQYHQARNCVNAGLYVEAYLMYCTTTESMISYWCSRIAQLSGKSNEYDIFSQSKQSSCDSCELYQRSNQNERPDKGMEPTMFKLIDFLHRECGVNKIYTKKLKRQVSNARSHRNDVIHGKENDISLIVIHKTEAAIMEIQEVFLKIENELSA